MDSSGATLLGEIRAEPGGELLGSFAFEWIDETLTEFEAAVERATGDAIPDGLWYFDWIHRDSNDRPLKFQSGRILKQGTITEVP